MKNVLRIATLALLVGLFACSIVPAEQPQRADVPEDQIWNLADVYPSDKAWEGAKEKLAGRIDEISQFEGRLAESPETLLRCLELSGELDKELTRLYCYASMKSDEGQAHTTACPLLGLSPSISPLKSNVVHSLQRIITN